MAQFDQCKGDCTTDCGACKGKPLLWAIVDEESVTKPGDIAEVVYRCETYGDAIWWLVLASDQAKVNRGGYGIDGPVED